MQLDDKVIIYVTNMPPTLARVLKRELGSSEWDRVKEKASSVEKTVVGIYMVVKPYYKEESDLNWLDRDGLKPFGNFPHRVGIESVYSEILKPIPLGFRNGRRLLEELLLFPDKSESYYNVLYPSMLAMLEEDYQTIKRYADASL